MMDGLGNNILFYFIKFFLYLSSPLFTCELFDSEVFLILQNIENVDGFEKNYDSSELEVFENLIHITIIHTRLYYLSFHLNVSNAQKKTYE